MPQYFIQIFLNFKIVFFKFCTLAEWTNFGKDDGKVDEQGMMSTNFKQMLSIFSIKIIRFIS